MTKITADIKGFIDGLIASNKHIKYAQLAAMIARKYGVKVSKATISKRAKALRVQFHPGRKRLVAVEKAPAHSVFLDCAGAFFLKGAELEIGLLKALSRLLATSSKSSLARRALKLAQQINALLLYSPIFGLRSAREIANYKGRGLLQLAGQKNTPPEVKITQYLRFLADSKLLPIAIKEVAKAYSEALFVRVDFAGQSFYLDSQMRTVWPSPKIPGYFCATINKTASWLKDVFLSASPQRPLILQTCPGYTALPSEMLNLIQCFEQAQEEPIARIVMADKAAKTLSLWQDVQPAQKFYFLAPLSPWQYANLQGTKIIKPFKQYLIGPAKESMAVADAQVTIFNPQLSKNIRVRAAMVRRKEERLALITNISRREERYIRKIAEQYFLRWPDKKVKTYYDLMEEAHEERPGPGNGKSPTTPSIAISYGKTPFEGFKLFLEQLNQYAVSRFFSSEYAGAGFNSMREKIYCQGGFLKIKSNCWQIFLRPFTPNKLQNDLRIACQKFNQSNIKFPDQRCLHILLK